MSPETTRDLVPLYVLGELKGEERVAFEMALHRSAELRRAVHDCSEAFADVAAAAATGCEASHRVWKRIEQQIAPTPAQQPTPSSWTNPERRRSGVYWVWPVAAAFLLVLNLIQWRTRRDPPEVAAEHDITPAATAEVSAESTAWQATSGVPESGPAGGETAGSGIVAGSEKRMEETLTPAGLEAENRRLVRENRRLIAENVDLREIVVPLVRADLQADLIDTDGVAVWMAELRARSGEGTAAPGGLWGRLRELVPENGVALVPDRFNFAAPVGGGVGVAGGQNEVNTAGGARDETPPPAAFALAVINPEEGIGYLDLYNLPVLPGGAEMRLWVQREGQVDFTSVGRVPGVLSGGSGGLAFRVEVGTGRPSRVMITIESAGSPSLHPRGPVVIEGP